VQHAQTVHPRQEQVEQDQVVMIAGGALEALSAVTRRVHRKPFSFESPHDEAENARLVFDHQNAHRKLTLTETQMTWK
jgi:hypothetical protein